MTSEETRQIVTHEWSNAAIQRGVASLGEGVESLSVVRVKVGIALRRRSGFVRATPFAVYPFGLTGGVLGGVLAFLLFGWASRRTEGRHPARAVVKMLLGVTLFLLVGTDAVRVAVDGPALSRRTKPTVPSDVGVARPAVISLPFLIGCGSALLGLALAAFPSSDRKPSRTVAAA